MPAQEADIGAVLRDVVTATWTDPTIAARYPSARDGSVSPATGYFDRVQDAQAVANARGILIGTDRRRFAVAIGSLEWPNLSAGFPTDRVIDPEQSLNEPQLVARIEIDLDAETTSHETFG